MSKYDCAGPKCPCTYIKDTGVWGQIETYAIWFCSKACMDNFRAELIVKQYQTTPVRTTPSHISISGFDYTAKRADGYLICCRTLF